RRVEDVVARQRRRVLVIVELPARRELGRLAEHPRLFHLGGRRRLSRLHLRRRGRGGGGRRRRFRGRRGLPLELLDPVLQVANRLLLLLEEPLQLVHFLARGLRGACHRAGREQCAETQDTQVTTRHGLPTPSLVRQAHCFGVGAYGLPPSAFETSVIAFCERTLFPAASSGGENAAMPNLPGDTAMIPPPTPLLAGRPTLYSQMPESSYRP